MLYRMHVCIKDEVRIPVTQSSVESIRNEGEVSWNSLRWFLIKMRTFDKLLVGERGEIGHDVQGRYAIWQLTRLSSHCDLFALWHTAQRLPLFQSAVIRGPRVEYIAANIRLLCLYNKNQQIAHFLL
jgi:hypothetical protein